MLYQAYVDGATYQHAMSEGALAAAVHLIMQPSDIWRKGSMVVEVMNKAVLVSDGVPVSLISVAEVCAGAFAKVEPSVVVAGDCCVLEASGGAQIRSSEPCTVSCRAAGDYVEVEVSALMTNRDKKL